MMKKNKIIGIVLAIVILGAAVFIGVKILGNNDNAGESNESINSSDSSQEIIDIDYEHDGFFVNGTKLYDANGNEFIMRGVNHAHTWFKDMLDIALQGIAETGSNTVRIVLSDGGQWTMDSAESVTEIIEKCKALNLIAILEIHDATGYDDMESLQKAVEYWIEIKDCLIGNEEYVLLNIANEWVGKWESKTWRDGYVSAIPQLRDAGIKNTIIVDSAGWGQYAQSIHKYAEEVFESDILKNTMFSIHMYGSAGKNANTIKKNIDGVTEQGYCVIIGEFGYNHSDGDVDENYIMSYCEEQGVGYLGWSWLGNGGDVTYLDIALEWDGSILSSDWGENLINGENGIRKTSRPCSIFE